MVVDKHLDDHFSTAAGSEICNRRTVGFLFYERYGDNSLWLAMRSVILVGVFRLRSHDAWIFSGVVGRPVQLEF